MTQYIDKSALVAEIERRKKYYENIQMIKPVYESNIEDFNELLSFLESLEVKEVVRTNTSLSDIDDDLKKLGVDPDSKQAKMLKDCYYRAIDRILEKGEEYARHG